MTFDKETYWKRRSEGKRGQGDLPQAAFVESETKHVANVGGKLQSVNRATARRKTRAKFYESAEDTVGKPYTAAGVLHTNGSRPFTPKHPARASNHTRHLERRALRTSSN